MLTREEEEHRDEIIDLTEDVLQARGIECDARIAKISEEQMREILEEVRKLRRKKKRKMSRDIESEEVFRQEEQIAEEVPYLR
jgi:ribosomal protein S13